MSRWSSNLTIFRDLSVNASAGLEINYGVDLDGEWDVLVMPQLHYELTDHVEIQTGIGVELTRSHADPSAALRLIYSR